MGLIYRNRLSFLVLFIGLLATLIAARVVADAEAKRAAERFDGLSARAAVAVRNKIHTQVSLLRGTAGLFAASSDVSKSDFAAYVERLELARNYPGVLGIGFAAYAPRRDVLERGGAARRDVAPRAFDAWPAGQRDGYSTIVFLEPFTQRNQAAIGFDMMSEPNRRAAMERARLTGQASLTAKVTLVQEIERVKQPGVLLYQPLSISDNFLGWAYSPLRAHDLFGATLNGPELAGLHLAVFDGAPTPANLLFENGSLADGAMLRSERRLTLAGRDLTIVTKARSSFEHAQLISLSLAVAIGGTLVSLLLAALVALQARTVRQVERRVRERTADLTAANVRLQQESVARSRAEAQVHQMQKMEAVGQLTGGIAHDFNNMLAVVIGNLDLAQRVSDNQARVQRLIGQARKGAEKSAELTQRLLAFARRQPLVPTVIEPNRLIGSMAEMLHRTLGEAIVLDTDLADGLWRVHADAAQLESAILNLAVNARDAMPGGGQLVISTCNLAHGDGAADAGIDPGKGEFVSITVRDSGMGMSDDVRAQAFEPFFTTKEVGKGTGLGLSQVFGFARQSGGYLTIESEPGQGTSVSIFLPRHEGAELEVTLTGAAAALPRGKDDECVLVVEDEADLRRLTVETLRELGYRVLEAADGSSALAVLGSNPDVRLLVTDIVMPGMDGLALADAAAERYPALRWLFTTGYARDFSQDHGRLEGGRALLTKPFTLEQLANKVRNRIDE